MPIYQFFYRTDSRKLHLKLFTFDVFGRNAEFLSNI